MSASFFRELKRRRVMSTSVYYIIAWWVLLQVADIIFPALGLDADNASRMLLLFAILGFPLNFAFAWYFQITSSGIVKSDPFVERRILNNIAPINDRRQQKVSFLLKREVQKNYDWIISAESGPLKGLSYGILNPIVIGRSLESDLAVVSPHVSRQHARLEIEEGKLIITDLGSSNGTVVNGKVVKARHSLQNDDEIQFHDIIFRVTELFSGSRQEKDSMNQTTFIHRTELKDLDNNA